MTIEYPIMRTALLKWFQKNVDQREGFNGFHGVTLGDALAAMGINQVLSEDDYALGRAILHEFYLERLIVPGAKTQNSRLGDLFGSWPHFGITPHGRKVFHRVEYSPYDPTEYLARLKAEIQDVDADILRYLEEALKCFQMDCLLAASVMLGCASEKAILLIIDQVGRAIMDPTKNADFKKKQQANWMISSKYTALKGFLATITTAWPKELKSKWEGNSDQILRLIQETRNDSGHPTGVFPETEQVHANLILFPIYVKTVYGLISQLQSNPIS